MSVRRCPNCGGLVTTDVKWCGQCFARLDDEEAAPPATPEDSDAGREPPRPGGTGDADAPTPPTERAGAPTAPGSEREASASRGERPAATGPSADGGAAPGPSPTRPAAGATGVRAAEGGRVVWDCPVCAQENDLEARACSRCGTPFGRLWEEPEAPPRVSPERAVLLSLVAPGAGQVAAGRVADGIARGVIFAFAVAMVVAILVAGGRLGGPILSLVVLFAGASLTLYLATAVDAYRAARRESPVLSTRVLLIGATVLLVVAVVVLLIGGSGAL